jgi:hypothetical protein
MLANSKQATIVEGVTLVNIKFSFRGDLPGLRQITPDYYRD